MTPEAVVLSPLYHPDVWVAFLLKWVASGLCVVLSIRLWRRTSARWWLFLSLAFLLPILGYIVQCWLVGKPPLPLGYLGTDRFAESATEPTATFTRTMTYTIEWDITAPLVALALWWAHRIERSKPEQDASGNAG
jgi:hypothetical protein